MPSKKVIWIRPMITPPKVPIKPTYKGKAILASISLSSASDSRSEISRRILKSAAAPLFFCRYKFVADNKR
jgi:hypothetical protein